MEKVSKLFAYSLYQAGDNSGNQHLKMLSLVAGKLGKKEVVEALLNANTVDDLEAAFM